MQAAIRLLFVLVCTSGLLTSAKSAVSLEGLVHTYSIVARDPVTGQLGVAVQSRAFAVGSVVTWAEAGVGAIASQSIADPTYGTAGLGLMRSGKSSSEALGTLLAADGGRELRQVAMIDVTGRVAVHTGRANIEAAGHAIGSQYAVQANLMRDDKVWPAMAKAFEAATGSLAERLLEALDAAQAAGGDVRGKQSAAMIVVAGKPSGNPLADRLVDLRVDDAHEPLKELRRLLVLRRAYDRLERARQAVRTGDFEAAEREHSAAAALVPGDAEFPFWHAVSLVRAKRPEDAVAMFNGRFQWTSPGGTSPPAWPGQAFSPLMQRYWLGSRLPLTSRLPFEPRPSIEDSRSLGASVECAGPVAIARASHSARVRSGTLRGGMSKHVTLRKRSLQLIAAAVPGHSVAQAVFVRSLAPIPMSAPDGDGIPDVLALLAPSPGLAAHYDLLMSLTELLNRAEARQALKQARAAAEIQRLFTREAWG